MCTYVNKRRVTQRPSPKFGLGKSSTQAGPQASATGGGLQLLMQHNLGAAIDFSLGDRLREARRDEASHWSSEIN